MHAKESGGGDGVVFHRLPLTDIDERRDRGNTASSCYDVSRDRALLPLDAMASLLLLRLVKVLDG